MITRVIWAAAWADGHGVTYDKDSPSRGAAMTEPAIIEAAAREVFAYDHDPMSWDDATDEARDGYRGLASVMLTAVTPLIEAAVLEKAAKAMEADRAERVAAIEEATLERAAKVAEDRAEWGKGMLENSRIGAVHQGACSDIAAAIRALKASAEDST